ncbi:hypothetical protein BH20ACT6_BH20ACT6_04920 [soil metagenome]
MIAVFFLPPLFGIAGIVLGAIAVRKGERLGWWAVGVSIAGLVLGLILGAVVFQATTTG